MVSPSCEFVWYELTAVDGPAAKSFYTAVVD